MTPSEASERQSSSTTNTPMGSKWMKRHILTVLCVIIAVLATTVGFLSIPVFSDGGYLKKPDIMNTKWKVISDDTQYAIAIHEAGHAIVNHLVLPDRVVISVFTKTGRPSSETLLGATTFVDNDNIASPETLDSESLVDYAGQVAEEVLLGDADLGNDSDTDHATASLYERIRLICDNQTYCYLLLDATGEALRMDMVAEKKRDAARKKAKEIIEENKLQVTKLANLIMLQPEVNHRRTLKGKELNDFLRTTDFVTPTDGSKTDTGSKKAKKFMPLK